MSSVFSPSRTVLYPLTLCNLANKRVVVVGGGRVGERKARGLLAAGADVQIISPEATTQIQKWAAAHEVTWYPKSFETGDLAGAFLVFAATNQRTVNQHIAQEAQAARILCNIADAPDEGDFYSAAVIYHEDYVIAVNTTKHAPRRAVQLRNEVAQWLQR